MLIYFWNLKTAEWNPPPNKHFWFQNVGKALRFSWRCLVAGLQNMVSPYTTPLATMSTVVTGVFQTNTNVAWWDMDKQSDDVFKDDRQRRKTEHKNLQSQFFGMSGVSTLYKYFFLWDTFKFKIFALNTSEWYNITV